MQDNLAVTHLRRELNNLLNLDEAAQPAEVQELRSIYPHSIRAMKFREGFHEKSRLFKCFAWAFRLD